ncbi:hypothetical protein BYT27DRAFT_7220934 [Phlegmacium glaucopus]|nr:hypothetical protein BYT27DRAFT_7220934 [Phlegmacium glaucopus]
MDEDTIDTEALQAQIDLSMSFAQNLVSSWIQPQKIPRNSHKKDLEKELSEYMQRPARLGVGASIPEGYNSTTRETARLKGKLAVTKRSREHDDAMAQRQPSDSEGESRANSIKKRPKYDPFDIVHGKKKKKDKDIDHEDANPQPIQSITVSPKEADNHPTLSPSKKKKKRKKLKVENDIEGCNVGASSLLCNGSSDVLNPPSTPPRSALNVSLTSTPVLNIQPRHKSIPLDLLKRPDRDSDPEGTPSSSPKKKRKRRRKKKNALMPSATDTRIDDTGNMSSSLK